MDRDTVQNPAEAQQPSASLRIEFRSSDPKLRASFRQAIVDWLTSAEGSLGRALGLPEGLAVDDPGERGEATEIRARWWRRRPGSLPAPTPQSAERIVFQPEAGDPIYRELPPVIAAFAIDRAAVLRPPRSGRLPAAALVHMRATLRLALRGGSLLRSSIEASSHPILTVRLPFWRLSPAAVILSALTVMTAGLTYGAIQAEEVHAPGRTSVTVAGNRGVAVPPLAASLASATDRGAEPAADRAREVRATAGAVVATASGPESAPAAATPAVADSRVPVVLPAAVAPAPAARAPETSEAARPAAAIEMTRTASHAAPQRLTGSLEVKSTPSGAEVSINGVARGRTPLVITGIPAGSRVVRLELEGYRRWSWAVTVTGKARTPLDVKLQPDAPPSPVSAALFER